MPVTCIVINVSDTLCKVVNLKHFANKLKHV